MDGFLERSLGNVESGSILLATSVDRLRALELLDGVFTAYFNPANGAGVTDEDLVGVDLDLFAVCSDGGATREMGTAFSRMNATTVECARDVEYFSSLVTTNDRVLGNIRASVQDPSDRAFWSVAVIVVGADLSIAEPGL